MKHSKMSGTEITLQSGDYTARIVTVGAGLAGLTLQGHDLIIGHSVDELPPSYLGKTLMPWPNRISRGTYTWEGQTYEVPVNEFSTGAALHGFMCWEDWRVVHADHDSATLGALISPRYGYPWALEAWVTYAVHSTRGLTVTLSAKNVGSEPAPYGVSSHPYLSVDGKTVDQCELTVPADLVLEVDENLAPVATRSVTDLDVDFRSSHTIDARRIDHAFTGLPDTEWTVSLRDPDTGLTSSLSANVPWVQVFSGDHPALARSGAAVEPMTCPPDAFNSGEDVIVLAPGESHTLTFTISGSLA
ncbi:aldose-1-epimerase [Schaalia sp. ZJ405]|uniref:aldose-1-epimerase n=1 Tax=Schaalia sp. ZJ405 TaxID=2709403 RepID=UPI001E30FFCC|nr:aldose-1-epimerase [Schaalia sp. ZJ405]